VARMSEETKAVGKQASLARISEKTKGVVDDAALLDEPAPYPLPPRDFRPSQAIKQNRTILQSNRGIAQLLT
jgi:hypothetical protein